MRRAVEGSAGARFREALEAERPLQIVGAVTAYSAKLARQAGFKALYLSGAGVANSSLAIPDEGMTTLSDVLIDASRLARATELPLLVDADTGWEGGEGIGHTVREMIRVGVAGIHLEDQVPAKRCGHLAHKQLVSVEEMVTRIGMAVGARTDPDFVVMARTDAVASEGLESGIERACRYRDAGADMIFAEALSELAAYREFCKRVKVPVLANVTEFGKTPLFTVEQLDSVGVSMVLYPLSAFRAMSATAEKVYERIRLDGTQQAVVPLMQTRQELYQMLDYDPGAPSPEKEKGYE